MTLSTSDLKWYGGGKEQPTSHTALILADIAPGQHPNGVIALFGREAYEAYQLQAYMREIVDLRKRDYEPRSPGFGVTTAAIAALAHLGGGEVGVEELGSTLFATVDKLRLLERDLFSGGAVPSALPMSFVGVEPSDLLAETAIALHPTEKILHVADSRDLPPATDPTVGRSYQATSYAFTTTEDLARWIGRSRFSTHGIWVSETGRDQTITRMGKRMTLFAYQELVERLAAQGLRAHHHRSERLRLGEDAFCCTWIVVERLSPEERDAFHRIVREHPTLNDASIESGAERGVIPDVGRQGLAFFTDPDDVAAARDRTTFDFSSRSLDAAFDAHLARLANDREG